jgi:2-amino-4-hydroxy-6-hydroxymethyldihydropteridine diphosphokinase
VSARRTGYLGLGSNVGDRREHLQAAADELRRRGITIEAASSTYDTEPVGLVLDQPEFLNACLRIVTELDPESLLDTCKATEQAVGRRPGVRHGPRVIDVDLLLLGDVELVTDRLTLPHPEVTVRRFVLVPLLELDPALPLPDGTPLAVALDALGPGQAVRRAGPPLALRA